MTMLSAPTCSLDLDIGAVERADGQRAVQRELHVAGARRLHAGGRDLLRQIGRRHDHLGQAHIVVRHEHHLQQAAHRRVVVDDPRDVVDQLDDQLGLHVARRRLAGEDLHPRHPVALGMGADRVVERDRLEDVEQLALVFVDALDLHVEQRARDRRRCRAGRVISLASVALLARLTCGELLPGTPRSSAKRSSSVERFDIVEQAVADRLADQLRQARIALHQPAPRRDAVGLVVDAVGIELVQMLEHRLLHQLGVQRRHAVDPVRADEGELAHAHPAAVVLVDQRHRRQQSAPSPWPLARASSISLALIA